MISFQDISVVVQGPITEFTARTLQSVREVLPTAELILSTWNGSDLTDLDYDLIVLSDDPGGYNYCLNSSLQYNVNRLIVSTVEGIKKASKPYVLKLRSDMELIGSQFIHYFDLCPIKTEYSYLNHKVLISNVYTPNPHFNERKMLFHVGDFFYFGLKKDIFNIFDIKLATKEIATFFKAHEPYVNYNSKIFCQYFPEQYIWLSFSQKYYQVDLKHPFDSTKQLIKIHDQILVSNTILIDMQNSGIKCLKYPFENMNFYENYSHKEYLFLYYKICLNSFHIPSLIHFSKKKLLFLLHVLYGLIKLPERKIRHFIKQKSDLMKDKLQ